MKPDSADINQLNGNDILLQPFWENVKKGTALCVTEQEVRALVEQVFFAEKPIQPLQQTEKDAVLQYLIKNIERNINDLISRYAAKALALTTTSEQLFIHPVSMASLSNTEKTVTITQKELPEIFSDPILWNKLRYAEEGFQTSAAFQGYRHFYQYGVLHCFFGQLFPMEIQQSLAEIDRSFYAEEVQYSDYYRQKNELVKNALSVVLKERFDELKQRCNADNVCVADIGGGMGLALKELQDIDPEIRTYNITVDPEPAMFETDEVLFAAAEYLPKRYEGTMHLVFSNMAFRYFVYPDIALRNVLKILAKEGEAYIVFSTDRSDTSHSVLMQRLQSLYADLEEMEKSGNISLNIAKYGTKVPSDWWRNADSNELRIGVAMHIRKHFACNKMY